MTISLRLSETDGVLIKRFADHKNETVSGLIRRLVLDYIEQDYLKLIESLEQYEERE
ncbi:MAG: DUF6290 family protein [Lachnospiraceae bacterium]|jgi:hypothetical protein